MTRSVLLARALLIPVGALSGALVGAVTGALAALPDPSLQAGSSLGFVVFASALGAAPGGAIGLFAGFFCAALLLAGDHLPGFGVAAGRGGRGRGGGGGVIGWGALAWLLTTAAVTATMVAIATVGVPIEYQASSEEALVATLAQPLVLSATGSLLVAMGVVVERMVLLRQTRR